MTAQKQRQHLNNQLEQKQQLLRTRHERLQSLTQALQKLSEQKASTEQQLREKTQTEQRLRGEIDDLNSKLEAKATAKRKLASTRNISNIRPVSTDVGTCGDNDMARFIYMKESGCSTTATNAHGCYGIGQDCNGVVRSLCGADYTCQNRYFTDYAIRRYSSWANAYAYWLSNHWW